MIIGVTGGSPEREGRRRGGGVHIGICKGDGLDRMVNLSASLTNVVI